MAFIDIKGYTIERELGKGGFAVVYSALDNKLYRKVAIKLEVGEHQTITKEAQILQKLNGT
jgi:serine/threonine protein kinase